MVHQMDPDPRRARSRPRRPRLGAQSAGHRRQPGRQPALDRLGRRRGRAGDCASPFPLSPFDAPPSRLTDLHRADSRPPPVHNHAPRLVPHRSHPLLILRALPPLRLRPLPQLPPLHNIHPALPARRLVRGLSLVRDPPCFGARRQQGGDERHGPGAEGDHED